MYQVQCRDCGVTPRAGGRVRSVVDGVGVTVAASIVLALASAGTASASVGGGAYALSANVNALLAPVSVGPLASVSLPAEGGGPFRASLVSANVAGLVPIGVAKASTEGNSGVGSARSSALLVDADIAGLVQVAAARSRCTATQDSAEGSAAVADLVVAGIPISTVNLGPNTSVALPVGSVILNEQRKDGAAGITVNAVHVSLNAPLVSADVVIGQSRCSVTSSTTRARKSSTRARAKRAGHANKARGSR